MLRDVAAVMKRVPSIAEVRRLPAPFPSPQALAWDGQECWLSSRDLGTLCRMQPESWKVLEEFDPPGIVWAAVVTNHGLRLTIGKGLNDDRHICSYEPGQGFRRLFACPEFTGSYLGFDGTYLYLSQWYKGRILQLDESGKPQREIAVGAEISGYTFVEGQLYVIRGHENQGGDSEKWRIARLDPRQEKPEVEDLATIPFAARSLVYDGECFWSNHRPGKETISFTIPK